jgi:type II secretory pathway pseudopilin PulG
MGFTLDEITVVLIVLTISLVAAHIRISRLERTIEAFRRGGSVDSAR